MSQGGLLKKIFITHSYLHLTGLGGLMVYAAADFIVKLVFTPRVCLMASKVKK